MARASTSAVAARAVATSVKLSRDRAYALSMVHAVCCLAGSTSFVDDQCNELRDAGIVDAIDQHDTPKLFDWLMWAFSFQGIADEIASAYLDRHGPLTWAAIRRDLGDAPSCPKLHS